jgi:tetratricopeptide (TPR) repeat protein
MAKVALRIYNHEIENLIGQGLVDEAIAHCRHILKTFPKHLETYRLLGKAYLEARRYNEAIDIFGRLLMAVPDDFVAHVGLSIIRDEENKLDDSIWHMERAFEAQPSNAAIQGELQRLYGRRDGMEPPKIRMTRGALARMYVTGELYPQAIAEIRGVLTEDSQRADMQVLLALAYFKSNQRADATDICNQLLKRYPYSYDANRIMVELLPATTGSIESTQVYRMRVSEMEPYSNFTKGSIFQIEEAPDASINLERLDYKPGDNVQMGQDWGSTLGIELGSSAVPALTSSNLDEQPDWLKSVGFGSDEPPIISPADENPLQDLFTSDSDSQAKDEIPDFLKAAGWGESNTPEQPTSIFDDDNIEPVSADLPDWLKNSAPTNDVPSQSASNDDVIETPDWLSGLGSSDPLEVLQNEANESNQASQKTNDAPDWLSELGGNQPMANSESNDDDDDIQPANIPDWLQGAQPKQEASSSVESLGASSQEQDDAVAWLESLAAKHGAKPEELVTDPNKRSETPPDWVAQAQTIGNQPQTSAPANVESLGASSQEQDDAVAWLESLAAKHGAKPEELVTDPNKRSETPPDWVAQAQTIGNTQDKPVIEEPAKSEAVENALNIGEQFFAEFEQGSSEKDETPTPANIPDWLSEASSQPFDNAQGKPVSNEASDLPNWLSDIDNQPQETEKLMGSQNLSDWLSGLDEEPGLELNPDILRGSQRAPFPSPQTEEPQKKAVPDWLSSLDDEKESDADSWQPPASNQTSEPVSVSANDSLPDWLADSESNDAADDDDLPPWLHREKYEEEGVPALTKPTSPTDWQPVASQQPAQQAPQQKATQNVPAPSVVNVEKKKSAPKQAKPKKLEVSTGVGMLSQAKAELDRGDIPEALLHYGKLIKRGKNLEEIIRDLSDSLYRYPVEVNIWQALGDAYMRANRLKEALDAYNKAEELIR